MAKGNCRFEGKGGEYFVPVIIHLGLLSTITFGIYLPWAWVKILKLKASHTRINEKGVEFTGTGGQLFRICIIYGLLSIITIGLYFPWAMCRYFQWRASNTIVDGKPSTFKGTGKGLFLFYLIHLYILPFLTLGLYYVYGIYRFYAWKEENTLYGGEKTSFGGGFIDFLKITIITWILNSVTFGLFTPWSMCMLYRWQIEGLSVGDSPEVVHFPRVRTNPIAVVALICIGIFVFGSLVYYSMSKVSKLKTLSSHPEALLVKRPIAERKIKIKKPVRVKSSVTKIKKVDKLKKAERTKKNTLTSIPEKYRSELKHLNNMLSKDPRNSALYYNRALIMAYIGELNKAEKDLSRAIELNPKDSDAFYNRGIIRVKMKRFKSAIDDFTRAIKLQPGVPDTYCNRGNAYFEAGDKTSALKDINTALRLNPYDPDLFFNRAIIYTAMGERKKADMDLKKAAELGHKEARLRLGLPPLKEPLNKTDVSRLRRDAIECNVLAFIRFMDPAIVPKVQRFEAIRKQMEEEFNNLYNISRKILGNKVIKQGSVIKYRIKGEDERWVNILGPQWKKIIRQNPDEPKFFWFKIEYGWTGECKVLQRLQACLEDRNMCNESPVEDSAFQIKKIDGKYKLISAKSDKEWNMGFKVGEGMIGLLKWAQAYVKTNGGRGDYEEFMINFAKQYKSRLMKMMSQIMS